MHIYSDKPMASKLPSITHNVLSETLSYKRIKLNLYLPIPFMI